MRSHLLVAGFLPLAGGGGTAGGGRFGVAVFPAAVTIAGIVSLLFYRGVVMLPLVGAPAVVCSLFGGGWVQCWLYWGTCERRKLGMLKWTNLFFNPLTLVSSLYLWFHKYCPSFIAQIRENCRCIQTYGFKGFISSADIFVSAHRCL